MLLFNYAHMRKILSIFFLFSLVFTVSCKHKRSGNPLVLVYARNITTSDAGNWVHAIEKLGLKNGFDVRVTDTTLLFTDDSLQNYAAVVFVNNSAMPLNYLERIALERFIQAGEGFAGIHEPVKTYD